jgi:uncharacterized membrane protein
MKKKNIYKFLYAISALLTLGFVIHTIIDACRYDSMLTSFPFYAFVIGHAVVYLVPSLIVFVAALVVKKKFVNKESK